MPPVPAARGPLSAAILGALATAPGTPVPALDVPTGLDPLADDDLHLALYCCYELHYRGLDGVDEDWEWDPGLLAQRARLEAAFEAGLREAQAGWTPPPADATTMDLALRTIIDADDGPSLARHLETQGTLEQLREFLVHRSAYQLKEADPHSWAIPRLAGPPKAALLEVQADEYGGGDPARMHAQLFADTMDVLGLDSAYGAYVDRLPGITLATVNLMSLFGLHRRHRGAIVGHLALFEMTSSVPNRRYANGLRRHGLGADATDFFDEHVAADAVHEQIAAVDLAGGLVRQDPSLAPDVLWGARCLLAGRADGARHLLAAWAVAGTSLCEPLRLPASA